MGITTFSSVTKEVRLNVERFFDKYLPEYEVIAVGLSSKYIYRVLAKRKETTLFSVDDFACWTCWNEATQSLNYGHYNLPEWKATEIFMGYTLPINPYRLDELASKAIHGLLLDDVESAAEYLCEEMELNDDELKYFGMTENTEFMEIWNGYYGSEEEEDD